MENSYVEVKVSFVHIVVLLVGVIIIGAFLFYLGYQAGKSSVRDEISNSGDMDAPGKSEEIRLAEKKKDEKQARGPEEPSISEEIKLHRLPAAEKKKDNMRPKPIQKQSYWAVQVGAFSSYANAKNYAAKFDQMGYPTEIDVIVRDKQTLHQVRVGNFQSRREALREQTKLEKMEKKKFNLVKPD